MKVLLLTDSDAFAGTERHILDLSLALKQHGVEPWVGCPPNTPLAQRAAASGLRHTTVPRDAISGVRAVRRAVAKEKFEVIHAHNGRAALFAALGGAKPNARQGRSPCRLVSTLHFINLAREGRTGLRAWASHRLHRWINERTSRWIAISDAVFRSATQRDQDISDRLVRIHNGSVAGPPCRTRGEVRAELGLPRACRLILSVARLEVEKDAATLLAAADNLAATGTLDWCWLVAGDGTMRRELEERTQAIWPNASPLRFLGRRDDVADLMAGADILVHPAPAEPFGLVLIEAMALGLPVIASRGGAAPEIVIDGETGSLFSPRDPLDLADRVRHFLTHSDLAALGSAGRDRFQQCFTADRMAREVAVLYEAVSRAESVPGNQLSSISCH